MARASTLEERHRILDLAQAGLTNREIAQVMNRSPYTIRKWRRRARQGAGPALASTMGRPCTGAMGTFPEAVRQQVLHWRGLHPGWGAKTLRSQLDSEAGFAGQALPSRATIGRWLKTQGLTRRYERHSELPQVKPASVRAPHQRWQMDAQGNEAISGLGTVALINLTDSLSRVRLLSFPCLMDTPRGHPTTEDYQLVLRLAFSHWGLPEAIQVDHESVFIDATSKSPYPTRLHLWLLALGVDLVFARGRPPNAQAIVERSHRLWYGQVVEGGHFDAWSVLFEALLARRGFLNRQLPCASLGDRPPLLAYPEARHSGRFYRPEVEASLLDLARVDGYLAQGCWYRRASKDATVRLGGWVYYVGAGHKRASLALRYEPAQRQLLFCDEAGQELCRRPIKGLDRETLLGEWYMRMPSFQLQLPFRWADQRGVRLCEQMGVRLNEH